MAIASLENLSIHFRGPALLEDVSCQIEAGQRIGLLGRNGSGKTTLLKIIAGLVEPDHGSVRLALKIKVAYLPQEVPAGLAGSVLSVVSQALSADSSESDSPLMQKPAVEFDHAEETESDWEREHRIEKVLTAMQLDADADVAAMSAGMKRRVLLARALARSPQLLLLDEPTNHLDIDAICWLEDFLSRFPAAFMFVTHDRQFLRRLATRILEIEGGKLLDWTCDYDTFLKRKEAVLQAQEKQQLLFDKKLAQEEAWIRRGIEARRTRNEGRVRALKALRETRRQRREKIGTSNLQIQEGIRSGSVVLRAEKICFSFETQSGRQEILRDFSTTILRGDKVGIIGPNGSGKTTLIKLLLGELEPQSGRVRLGTNLQIAYFDQLRLTLDNQRTVEQDVADGYDTVTIDGQPRHVLGYLQEFLFTPERARTQISKLSGGERNRVLLAKLFAKPANVILLDEPTNDLDSETLEVLEQRLVEYQGTLLVVSHDREFLNNVVTSCLVFEPHQGSQGTQVIQGYQVTQGYRVHEYVGGYDDWQRQRAARAIDQAAAAKLKSSTQLAGSSRTNVDSRAAAPTTKNRRLSYQENKELESLPARIDALEAAIAELHRRSSQADFYKQPSSSISAHQQELASLEKQLEEAYHRWQHLDALAAPSN